MTLFPIVAVCAGVLLFAYFVYARLVMRWLGVDGARTTPAVAMNDGNDYCPAPVPVVLGGHFTAIAAAGPIVGPILAGLTFGWVPALIWIILGSILIGAVHDSGALFASIRHNAGSITQVVRQHMSRTAYIVFLLFIWLSLIYVVIAFADVTAGSFAKLQTFAVSVEGKPASIAINGGAVVIGAFAYLMLSLVLGLLLRFTRLTWVIGLPVAVGLMGVAVWVSPSVAQTLADQFPAVLGFLDTAQPHSRLNQHWDIALIVYCSIASIAPMWLLLQPRGLIGATFLYATLLFGVVGSVVGMFMGSTSMNINFDRMFTGELGANMGIGASAPLLFPFLFITIACGACSGFHAVVASGTTSKQIRSENDIKPVAFGAMLLEALVAVFALSCVMVLATGAITSRPSPDAIFAQGIGNFMNILGIDLRFAILFGLLAFSSFVFDTLDVCTRLGRYVLQELLGVKGFLGGAISTFLTLAFPAYYLWASPSGAWLTFWVVFGTSNQLLAALTLVGVAVWLARTGRPTWFVVLPAIFMLTTTVSALLLNLRGFYRQFQALAPDVSAGPVVSNIAIAVVLLILATIVVADASRVLVFRRV